ncbi:MAG: thioredoxin domain-containing protein [Gammaproteobacteria bacterium]|nr:thioredoxin domain-containing protein [Gammaproteobacteria bacterium]
MKELVEGEVLQEQIAIGIQRFVQEQRAAAQARQQQGARERVKNMRPVSIERDHIYGDTDATVSLIEYSDFECPYCKRFHPIAKALVDASDGKVNWVYRHFPLGIHDPGATREALASECAGAQGGNDVFWKYADAIFERTTSNGNGFPASRLVPLAGELGLDTNAFEDCLKSERYKPRVEEDMRDGIAIGITGTPGNVLLNNETREVRVIPGAVPLARLEAGLKSLLE